MTDFDAMSGPAKNPVESELQDFLMMEKQRMQVTQQVSRDQDQDSPDTSGILSLNY